MNHLIIKWTLVLVLLSWSRLAYGQSLGRKVFSAGGATGTLGIQHYAYTFGEPIVGTDMSNLPILTRGFHQPIIDNALNASLEHFTGALDGNDGLLQWQFTGFPHPIAFEVYRGWGGNGFERLAMLPVDPGSQVTDGYAFTDPDVVLLPVNRAGYQLKMLFSDGSFALSHVVELSWEKRSGHSLLAYPNPASTELNMVFSAAEPAGTALLLRNAMGQVVRREIRQDPAGQVHVRWDVSDLSSGVYVLSLQVAGKMEELWVRVVH